MLEAAEIEANALHAAAQQSSPNEDDASPGDQTGSVRTFRVPDSQPDRVRSAVNKARRAEKGRQQSEAKRDARESSNEATLTDDDLRLTNHALELLSGLDTLQTELSLGEDKEITTNATDNGAAKWHRS